MRLQGSRYLWHCAKSWAAGHLPTKPWVSAERRENWSSLWEAHSTSLDPKSLICKMRGFDPFTSETDDVLVWQDAALGSEAPGGGQELWDGLSAPASLGLEACLEGKAELSAERRFSSPPLQVLRERNV